MTTTPRPDDPERRQFLQRTAGATLTVVGASTFLATSASASGPQGVLADGLTVEPDYRAFMGGYLDRYRSNLGVPEGVETLADRARNEFNANAQAWVDYGNYLLDEADVVGSGDATVGVTFEIGRTRWPTRDESVATTIDVGVDGDQFDSLEWHADEPDDPDFEVTLSGPATENAADELSEFRREFIDDGHQVPDDEYLNTVAGKYAGSIGLGSDTKSVLEVLLGDVNV